MNPTTTEYVPAVRAGAVQVIFVALTTVRFVHPNFRPTVRRLTVMWLAIKPVPVIVIRLGAPVATCDGATAEIVGRGGNGLIRGEGTEAAPSPASVVATTVKV